jgi:hypothetical protein
MAWSTIRSRSVRDKLDFFSTLGRNLFSSMIFSARSISSRVFPAPVSFSATVSSSGPADSPAARQQPFGFTPQYTSRHIVHTHSARDVVSEIHGGHSGI